MKGVVTYMKKNLILMLGAISSFALFSSLSSNAVATKAEEADLTPNFDEDFESYAIETQNEGTRADINAKWTNGWYEKTGDNNEIAGQANRFYVTESPTDPSNKVLRVDTASYMESFFYLTMKDIYVKNFKLSYDLYQTVPTGAWTGFNFRKPMDGRYNGVTNVMMVVRSWEASSFGVQTYRSVDASFMNVEMTNADGTAEATPYNASNFTDFAGAVNTWLKVEISVIDTEFSISINGHVLGKTTITKKTAQNYGYVSLVSCVSDAYYDNIHLENLDEKPYTPNPEPTDPEHKAPTIENNVIDATLGEDVTIDFNLYGEQVTSIKQAVNELLSQYYTVDGNKVTISKDYLEKLGEGRWTFILTTEGGSVGFTISLTKKAETPSTSTSEPTTSNVETKGGCGGAIVGSSIAAVVALAGLSVVAIKRKKDN